MPAWIFQSNPHKFRIDDYIRDSLSAGKDIIFGIRQECYLDDIFVDDDVFIWRSDGDDPPGIIARGMITTKSKRMGDYDPGYWIIPDPSPVRWRVKIHILEYRPSVSKGMLSKYFIETCPELSDLTILKNPQHTNYYVNDEEADALLGYWSKGRNTGKNWKPPSNPLSELFD